MIPQRETAFGGALFRDHCSVRKGQEHDKVFSQGHSLGRAGAADDDTAKLLPPWRRSNRPLRFRYRPEDVVCKHCTEYRRGGCTEEVCPWLEERVEAGTVTYTSLAAEFYRKWLGTALGERIQELLRGKRSIAYYDSAHTDRLALYALFLARHRSDHRALAAMYLLTATETLRRCAIPRIFDLWGIDIRSWSAVRTLSEQEYVLFQAAKGIWQSQRTITIPELCDRKLVEDKTLELILNAALVAHYGRAMLAFDRREGRT